MDAHQQNLGRGVGRDARGALANAVDDICDELERAELTEEETTSLLNDALELNKRLKEELRRQEVERPKGRDGTRNPPGGGARGRVAGRRADAVSASLPPINPKRGPSAIQRRIYASVETGGGSNRMKNDKAPCGMQRKTHSADGSLRPASSSHPRPRGTQSAESKQRPEWNDRFAK